MHRICKKNKINLMDLALEFLKRQDFVSDVIFGISSINQLEKFLQSWKVKVDDKI